MNVDLSSPESVERMRRSLAMLAPRAWALRREEAIEVLEVLLVALDALRAAGADGWGPNPPRQRPDDRATTPRGPTT